MPAKPRYRVFQTVRCTKVLEEEARKKFEAKNVATVPPQLGGGGSLAVRKLGACCRRASVIRLPSLFPSWRLKPFLKYLKNMKLALSPPSCFSR